MKPLQQRPGEKPERYGIFRETPFKRGEENYCFIEIGDKKMPPTKHDGAWWEWVSYDK